MTGKQLAHFQIIGKLGEGGMGVVYEAVDHHLDRHIALKILPPEKVANAGRKLRFIQEAKAASALNHPNIITIYDISATNDVDYIAMELVHGRTLEGLLARGRPKIADALKYAVQIADALAAAHAAGIVHRDVKPANVMVTESGLVKVLDFGLAKLTHESEATEDDATRTERAVTEDGAVVGSAAYMSPEQVEGRKIDTRSDIFSFGLVLYEMLSGERGFRAVTRIATMAAVLNQEPVPLGELVPGLPKELERIVARCLRKNRERRFQHMDDIKLALEDLSIDLESGRSAPVSVSRPSYRRIAWFALAALAVTAGGVRFAWLARPRPLTREAILQRLTSDSGLSTDAALSPDGKLVAFASDRSGEGNLDIWVQQIADGTASRLTNHTADESTPCFSPDGSKIAFRSQREGGGIYVVPVLGGQERLIAGRGYRPRFSPDGKWITYMEGTGNTLLPSNGYIIPATGGTARRFREDFLAVRDPIWSPDGKHILFLGARKDLTADNPYDLWVTSVEEGSTVQTHAMELVAGRGIGVPISAQSWRGDRVVFSSSVGDSRNLFELTLSATWQAATLHRLTSGAALEFAPDKAGDRLVYSSLTVQRDLWSIPLLSDQRGGEPERLTDDVAEDFRPSISLDGHHLAYISSRSGNRDVWYRSLQSGKEHAITASPEDENWPVISPDGRQVIYTPYPHGREMLPLGNFPTLMSGVESGGRETICSDCQRPEAWSADGKFLLFLRGQPGKPTWVSLRELATGKKVDLLNHPEHNMSSPRVSPDGRWIAFYEYISPQSRRIWVAPFRGAAPISQAEWTAVTDGTTLDREPRWSTAGDLLYFNSTRDGFICVWAQRLDATTRRPIGPAFPVAHFHRARLSFQNPEHYSASGSRIIITLTETRGNVWLYEQPNIPARPN